MSAVGERIKSARKARRLTQETLAKRVEVSRATIAKWECGYPGYEVPRKHRQNLADALGVAQYNIFGIRRGTTK